jgi:hypothetical protein
MPKKADMSFWKTSNNLVRFLQGDAEASLDSYQKALEQKMESHRLASEHELAENLAKLLSEVIALRQMQLHLSMTLVAKGMEPYTEDVTTGLH